MAQTIAKKYAKSFIVVPFPSEHARIIHCTRITSQPPAHSPKPALACHALAHRWRAPQRAPPKRVRIGAQFNRHPIAAALAFIGEVDGQRVIQRNDTDGRNRRSRYRSASSLCGLWRCRRERFFRRCKSTWRDPDCLLPMVHVIRRRWGLRKPRDAVRRKQKPSSSHPTLVRAGTRRGCVLKNASPAPL